MNLKELILIVHKLLIVNVFCLRNGYVTVNLYESVNLYDVEEAELKKKREKKRRKKKINIFLSLRTRRSIYNFLVFSSLPLSPVIHHKVHTKPFRKYLTLLANFTSWLRNLRTEWYQTPAYLKKKIYALGFYNENNI